MKLFCCVKCKQVVNFQPGEYFVCRQGHGGGKYVNDLDIAVWGPHDQIFVLGFVNSSFVDAIQAQIRVGNSDGRMRYGGRWVAAGRLFDAFIVPEGADSVHRFETFNEFFLAYGPSEYRAAVESTRRRGSQPEKIAGRP